MTHSCEQELVYGYEWDVPGSVTMVDMQFETKFIAALLSYEFFLTLIKVSHICMYVPFPY